MLLFFNLYSSWLSSSNAAELSGADSLLLVQLLTVASGWRGLEAAYVIFVEHKALA